MTKWKLTFHIFLSVLFGFLLHLTTCQNYSVIVEELKVGKLKNFSLNNTHELLIKIVNLPINIEKAPPRIFIKCEKCVQENPLLIVVKQSKGVLSWELPVVIESNKFSAVYKTTERTLCPYDIKNSTSTSLTDKDNVEGTDSFIILSFSTSSFANVTVELIINLQTDFLITENSNQTVEVTPSSPFLFLYEFPPDVNSILVNIISEDDSCMIVSIQRVSCPVFDREQDVQYRGNFQTVSRKGGLTVTKEVFPNGFYIVLILRGEDNYCYSNFLNGENERTKRVTLSVSKTISSLQYKQAVALTLVVLFLFCAIMFIIDYHYYKKEKAFVPELDNPEDEAVAASASHTNIQNNSNLPDSSAPGTRAETLSFHTDSSLDETDYDLASDVEFDKDIFRMKDYLYVCDLARKKQNVLKKKSEIYLWNLLTVAIFYFLPVIQLVVTNQFQLNQSGQEDLCYYNFLCSHPLWFFSDFNHVFSNIGYLMLGTLFMLLTCIKERLYNLKICSDKKLCKEYGIPQHFGLFYAMGAALIIEGVMSACYHICPNHYNFQFDSSFMYVICTLCMIKIYQTRHPDINAAAYTTFFLLAGVIFIGMCGVFNDNLTFRILFTILHISTCSYISLQIYYMGSWKFKPTAFARICRELRICQNFNLKFFLPLFPFRFLLLILANTCNWALAAISFWYDIHNFSSYLLTIFMMNLMLYTSFYIIMKFICKEKILLRSFLYILLSIFGWSSALYFFFNKTTSWRLTPAQSRVYNHSCELLGFYDNHDIWHFISATAMFFSFNVLLTLDDDLMYVHRSKILVF